MSSHKHIDMSLIMLIYIMPLFNDLNECSFVWFTTWSRLQVSVFNTSSQDDSSWWQSSQPSACYQPLHTPDWLPSSQTFTCWDPTKAMKASEASYQPSHIYSPEPSAYQSGQSHSLTQYKPVETAPSLLEICTLHPQTPERVFGLREK